jgi:Flp pilus assembly protein TadG
MMRNREAGQAIASVALGLVVLTGIVGLAIDMGYLRYAKRRMQSAADSAAIAGASELAYASGNYVAAAKNDSNANGFGDGANGVTVTASNPPVDAPFSSVANANNYVEVRVHQDVPTFFMRVFGVNTTSLSATAVAQLGSSRGCVYSLDLVLGITLGGNLTASNCGVVDNAVLNLGGGCITAASIGVVLNILGGACATPTPVTGIAPSADPLAYLTAPAVGACIPNPNINQAGGPPVVLVPGTYCGITVASTNVVPIVFSPGLYVVTGAPGLQLQGPSTATGTGVVFFMTNGAGVQITGPGNTSLTAPTDTTAGIPGGVLFFQDRANLQPATITNPNLSLTGGLYFPSALLTLGANNPTPYLILVAQSIQLQGNVSIGTDYSSLTNGSPIKAAVLVQ